MRISLLNAVLVWALAAAAPGVTLGQAGQPDPEPGQHGPGKPPISRSTATPL